MQTLSCSRLILALAMYAVCTATHAAVATFDDLPLPPAFDASTGIQFTNNSNSLDYAGVTWSATFSVVGDAYRVQPSPPGPLFGIPHSGQYFVTNQGGGSVSISTNQILTGAWFGRNEYYGFGAGADQITIVALSGEAELGAVVFDLPENNPGEPEPLAFVDTSLFASLSGITGYRIDRHELGSSSGNWVADDFSFTPVPVPAAVWLFGSALAGLLTVGRRRRD